MTNKTNTGGPAFPGLHPSAECRYQEEGMTLRDYFAAKAMQSAFSEGTFTFTREDYLRLARVAYAMADEMLKERGQ